MSLQIEIPETVVQAIRLPEERISQELLIELAVSTYREGILSFGKARELAGIKSYEFSQLLEKRQIPRHYGHEELEDDLSYAREFRPVRLDLPVSFV